MLNNIGLPGFMLLIILPFLIYIVWLVCSWISRSSKKKKLENELLELEIEKKRKEGWKNLQWSSFQNIPRSIKPTIF